MREARSSCCNCIDWEKKREKRHGYIYIYIYDDQAADVVCAQAKAMTVTPMTLPFHKLAMAVGRKTNPLFGWPSTIFPSFSLTWRPLTSRKRPCRSFYYAGPGVGHKLSTRRRSYFVSCVEVHAAAGRNQSCL